MMNPSTFKQQASGSGLYVPEEFSRERHVCTHDELRLIDRALKLLASCHLKVQMACPDPKCTDSRGKVERRTEADGSVVLRCEHLDRTFAKAF